MCLGAMVAAVQATSARADTINPYTVTGVGVLSGYAKSYGLAVNSTGVSVGYATRDAGLPSEVAFEASGGGTTALGALGGSTSSSRALGINSNGLVVGMSGTTSGYNHAFLYNGSTMTDLGTLGGKGFSEAFDVNDNGMVVGDAITRGGADHAFSYTGGKLTDLGVLSGGTGSEARAVNVTGQIVGFSYSSTGIHRAFLYSGGTMSDLGTLGGAQADAYDINAQGDIIGDSVDSTGSWHGFVYTSGLMISLGPVGSAAYSINDDGEIVGNAGGHAVIFNGSTATDLNTLIPANSGWVLTDATGINNAGQIVGTGTFNGSTLAYLLTPSLLGRYAPQIRYDSQEAYRADSAAEATDNYSSAGSNKYWYWNGVQSVVTADANPSSGLPLLSLDYLGEQYGATSNDYIDEVDNYVDDFTRMHASSAYANQVYGRDFVASNGDHVLQYWFYLYYNQKTFVEFGEHEGDWEGIQIHTDAAGNVIDAAYSQHQGAVVCPWASVEHDGAHPVVYMALGSHASYFTPGSHDLTGGQSDRADGLGEQLIPGVVDITSPPPWITWPGRWGASTGIDSSSPTGPGAKGQRWLDPLGWQATQSGCTGGYQSNATSGTVAATFSKAIPPAPHLRIVRDRRFIRIAYSFPIWPKAKNLRPAAIVSSVKTVDSDVPRTVLTKIATRTGVIRQRVGSEKGSYAIIVSAFATTGNSSKLVRVTID